MTLEAISVPSQSYSNHQCLEHLLLLPQTLTLPPEGNQELRFVKGGQPMGRIAFHSVIVILDPSDVHEHMSLQATYELCHAGRGHTIEIVYIEMKKFIIMVFCLNVNNQILGATHWSSIMNGAGHVHFLLMSIVCRCCW